MLALYLYNNNGNDDSDNNDDGDTCYFHDLVDEEARGHEVGHGHQSLEVEQVALDGLGYSGILDLHCHSSTVVENSLMDLGSSSDNDNNNNSSSSSTCPIDAAAIGIISNSLN